jgi:pantetheine-phosphate adenylyltransferase
MLFWMAVYIKKKYKYQIVATGGTFDHLHRGHRSLLEKAFDSGELIMIGVTSDEFAKRMGKELDHDYQTRVRKLRYLLQKNFPNRKYRIVSIDDFFGPEIIDKKVEALVTSEETASRIDIANKQREKMRIPPLDLIVIKMVVAENGIRISSTRIKHGNIDSEGKIIQKGNYSS